MILRKLARMNTKRHCQGLRNGRKQTGCQNRLWKFLRTEERSQSHDRQRSWEDT